MPDKCPASGTLYQAMNGEVHFYSGRSGRPFWRFTNPILLFVGTLVVVMGFGALAMSSPLVSGWAEGLFKIFAYALLVAAVLVPLVGISDCLSSNVATNTKLLWIIVILLAPILGTLLWFFWGKPAAEPVDKDASASDL